MGLNTFFCINVTGQYSDTINVQKDTVDFNNINRNIIIPKKHSPHKASLYSAILPGLGQAYNKKYWKIPIVYALLAGSIYILDFNSTHYKNYKRAYRDYLNQDPGNTYYMKYAKRIGLTKEQVTGNGTYATYFKRALENKRAYYKKYRDLSYVGIGLVYVLNIIDATVDAHFKTFDVSDDLTMRIDPILKTDNITGNTLGLNFRFTF